MRIASKADGLAVPGWSCALLVLLLSASWVAGATSPAGARVGPGSAVGSDPPHIVVIMLDDLDRRTLRDALSAGMMPRLQHDIIEQAVEFSDALITNPICCPSRASFLSGRYSHNHGVVNNSLRYGERGFFGAVGMFDDSDTLATRLRQVGYRTAHVGKYLNGYGSAPDAADLSPAFLPDYVPPGWDEWYGTIDPFTYCMYRTVINANGRVLDYAEWGAAEGYSTVAYQTDVLADLAERLLLENVGDGTPFFLALMPLAPHWEACSDAYGGEPMPDDPFARRVRPAPADVNAPVPAFAPGPAYDEDTSDKPDFVAALDPLDAEDLANISAQYESRMRALLAVDRMIGRVIDAIGVEIDDTVVIFTSDNGWLYGDHRLSEKVYAYDESARVPLYVRVPGRTQAATRPNLVVNNDLAPTILALASPGYPDADFDGRSFAPLLFEAQPPGWIERARVLIEHVRVSPAPIESLFPTYYAVRTPELLYTETFDGDDGAPGPLVGLERYDLAGDPWQLDSLIRHPGDSPDAVLRQQLQTLRECAGVSCKAAENPSRRP